MLPLNRAHPGFDVTYKLIYTNIGTDTVKNATVQLLKNRNLTVVSSIPPYSSITGDTVKWVYSNLKPLDTASVTVTLLIAAPPFVNSGDSLTSIATINPVINDIAPNDDTAVLTQIATNSADPNYKSESHAGKLSDVEVSTGEYLQYTIEFQNTGNDTAFNITVKDTLSDKPDRNTLQMVDASNDYALTISNGNKCEWTFNNILLPDSNINESASHGYITYRIKPKKSVAKGDVINNSASIYFDYNLPVKTNTEVTTVAATTLPLQLISFTGFQKRNWNVLQWITSQEVNTKYFEVERSSDGEHFSSIGVVNASSIAALESTYSFNDIRTFQNNYYRLKIVDKDGSIQYSKIILLNAAGTFKVIAYPNPVRNNLTIEITSSNSDIVKLELTNMHGELLKGYQFKINSGVTVETLNLSELSNGTYFLRLKTSSNNNSIKIVKE